MPGQLSFRSDEEKPEGLRSLKKLRTRRSIEDAAFELFAAQGYEDTTVDQIAALAEVSTTTFFRYFPNKSEVVLGEHGQQLPALHRAILERPRGETELVCIRRAVVDEFVRVIDPERTATKARIVATSPVLQGLSYERGGRWLEVIAGALARRRRLKAPDERAVLAARVGLAVLASTVEAWIASGCRGNLVTAAERGFELMGNLCADWSDGS